ncbi:MAG: PadR family transcriptional regulator [Pirellulaceae bacterium]|nr:MAG: PadR family transcriptional regulator [Pirellulaceae bacterium]
MRGEDLMKYFFGGFVRVHILHHAAEEPVCGVYMMEELARHGYQLSPGTLYPILHQLTQSGYLRCQQRVVEGRRRKYYRITPSGRKLLCQAREKLQELAGEVLHPKTASTAGRRAARAAR